MLALDYRLEETRRLLSNSGRNESDEADDNDLCVIDVAPGLGST